VEPSGTIETERQRREREYHAERAKKLLEWASGPCSFEIVQSSNRRWWNAYWSFYTFLLRQNLKGKKVLVVGCGFGDDALRLAKMGCHVEAFDLSPESLDIASNRAKRDGLNIGFRALPAENLDYESDYFDCVVAYDVLHHIDIPRSMREFVRVSKPGALFATGEPYTYSVAQRIRDSRLVEKVLYPALVKYIYMGKEPYITEDERKLNERDVAQVSRMLERTVLRRYFNFVVTRMVPERYDILTKSDQILLRTIGPIGSFVAGRVLLAGPVLK